MEKHLSPIQLNGKPSITHWWRGPPLEASVHGGGWKIARAMIKGSVISSGKKDDFMWFKQRMPNPGKSKTLGHLVSRTTKK